MPDDQPEPRSAAVFSSYGVVSAVLGVVAVVAIALGVIVWSDHRDHTDELAYRTQAVQAAAEWTAVLINMNVDTVEGDLNTLREGTVGQLNADFEATVQPYRALVQRLKSRTRGQVDSAAMETIHHDRPGAQAPQQQPELAGMAARTDTVLVVATSISENVGTEQPQTVRWTLRLDVSDVDGKLLISRLEPIR